MPAPATASQLNTTLVRVVVPAATFCGAPGAVVGAAVTVTVTSTVALWSPAVALTVNVYASVVSSSNVPASVISPVASPIAKTSPSSPESIAYAIDSSLLVVAATVPTDAPSAASSRTVNS